MEALKRIQDKLFNTAKPELQIQFLMEAMICISDEMLIRINELRTEITGSIEKINGNIDMVQKSCPWRQGVCEERFDLVEENLAKKIDEKAICFKKKESGFVTRTQAYIVGMIIVALSFVFTLGINVGQNIITKTEALKEVTDKLLP